MSLIVIPGKPKDLAGRILALNMNVCRKFQCGGFWLNISRPWAVVEPGAQQDMLNRALLDGRLLDVTDQSLKGLSTPEGDHSAPRETEEKGAKVYIQLDAKGNVLIIAPKNEAEEEKMEQELKEKGSLHVDHYEVADHGIGESGKIDSHDASEIINNMANKLDDAKSKFHRTKLK